MTMTPGETAPDRRIHQLSGTDALPFLQGLTSNDVLPLAKGPGIVWTALLTPQGKYLADFLVVNTGAALLIDIKESLAPATLQRLSMYRLRSDVQISPAEVTVTRGLGPVPTGALPTRATRRLAGAPMALPGPQRRSTGTPSGLPIASPKAGSN